MKCARSQELLSAFLDRELDEAASSALTAHLNACRSCAEEMQALEQVKLALRSMAAPRCPDSVWLNLSNKIAQEPVPVLPRRRGPLVSPVWALAAAAMLAIGAVRPSGNGTSTFQALLDGPPASRSASPVPAFASASVRAAADPGRKSPTGRLAPARRDDARLAADRVAMLPGGISEADSGGRERSAEPGLPLRIQKVSAFRVRPLNAPARTESAHLKLRVSTVGSQHPTAPRPSAPPIPDRPARSGSPVLVAMLPPGITGSAARTLHQPDGRRSAPLDGAAPLSPPPAHDSTGAGSNTGALTSATTSSIVSLAAVASDQRGDDAAAEQTGKDLLGMAMEAGAVNPGGSGA